MSSSCCLDDSSLIAPELGSTVPVLPAGGGAVEGVDEEEDDEGRMDILDNC